MLLEMLTLLNWRDALITGNVEAVKSGLEQGYGVNAPIPNQHTLDIHVQWRHYTRPKILRRSA